VQTLLKLDDIDQTRAILKTTENKLDNAYSTARTQASSSEDSLKRHLDLPALKADDLLQAVNKRRTLLSLVPLTTLTKDTDLSEGISEGAAQEGAPQSKESAIADVQALLNPGVKGFESDLESSVEQLLQGVAKIGAAPSLLASINRHAFVQSGLGLVDGPNCPLCDTAWDMEELRAHLRDKLERSQEAQAIREQMLKTSREIAGCDHSHPCTRCSRCESRRNSERAGDGTCILVGGSPVFLRFDCFS
jgi:uncharacterized phage infection (PIP) family protein YhgE